ncbi:MAG: adenosylmethionine--8-amino-7-oxononanoate transaminase [Nitrospirota bacterium]
MNKDRDYEELKDLDHRHLWHPFTQMKDWLTEDPIIIVEGEDCFLKDARGRWYLDGVSSIWVNVHGHRKAQLDEAIRVQLGKIAHSTMLGISNAPAIEFAGRLVRVVGQSLGPSLTRVFYSDNGSTAVEAALKMAFQYWRHRGVEGRDKFVSLSNAYHGDTLGAVSVGGIDVFHEAFGPLLFKTLQAPSPYCYRCELADSSPGECGLECLKAMDEILGAHRDEVAAVILEPMVQGAGGMIVFPGGYLKGVRELCTRHGVLLIADEVATGFGRTGMMFACEHEGVSPDILCLSKGITGGYLPLAATLATEEVFGAFLGEYRELKTFFHGHSYTGNPLACACGMASLDVFERERVIEKAVPKAEMLRQWLLSIASHPHVGEARGLGLMAGVELVAEKATKEPFPWEEKVGVRACYAARERGVLVRPLGNVVVIMPPLSISEENLARMLEVMGEAIGEATSEWEG